MGKHSLIPSLNNFALMARSKITVSCSQLSKSNICYRRDTLFASDFTWSWRNSSCCRHLKLSTFNLITRLLCIPLSHITYSPEASYAHSKKQHYMQRNFRLIWSISANQSNMKVWRQRGKKIFYNSRASNLQGTVFYKCNILDLFERENKFKTKQNTYCGCICWGNPTGGFCLMVNAIWVTGPTFGGTCTFWEKACWAACWGMGHGGTTGLQPPVEDVSCMTVSSQELPFVPGLHTQSWGRRHIPPFWHGGAQLAMERHFKMHLWN